jgi:probable F420-dependent oxidoreductase
VNASDVRFGLALKNFVPTSEPLNIGELVAYARRGEDLGFASLWAWDHILLGSKLAFPFLESLSVLAHLAGTTSRVQLGTGVLVLPLRNPVVLAKVTSTIDHLSGGRLVLGVAAGWYEREFEAVGVPFDQRGRVFLRNFEVLNRFWTETRVDGEADGMVFRGAVMLPPPSQKPRPTVLFGGYVDRVLRRVATRSDGWLTYFYTAESFSRAWRRILQYADEAGRNSEGLQNVAQLPICVDESFEKADARVRDFIGRYFDVAPWSESTPDSSIRGRPDDCADQLKEHIAAGAQHIVLVPCDYDLEQVERIATEVVPSLGVAMEAGAQP